MKGEEEKKKELCNVNKRSKGSTDEMQQQQPASGRLECSFPPVSIGVVLLAPLCRDVEQKEAGLSALPDKPA